MGLKLYDKINQRYVSTSGVGDDPVRVDLMKKSGLTVGLGFEDFGVQSDGQVVVFDKCGNFGYLSSSEFEIHYYDGVGIAAVIDQ